MNNFTHQCATCTSYIWFLIGIVCLASSVKSNLLNIQRKLLRENVVGRGKRHATIISSVFTIPGRCPVQRQWVPCKIEEKKLTGARSIYEILDSLGFASVVVHHDTNLQCYSRDIKYSSNSEKPLAPRCGLTFHGILGAY